MANGSRWNRSAGTCIPTTARLNATDGNLGLAMGSDQNRRIEDAILLGTDDKVPRLR